MTTDELPSTRAIRTPVLDEEGIQASFDNAITYAKGAAVLGMVEGWVGAERFAGFLRTYLERFRWRNASAEDFVGVMREQLGDQAAQVFASYLDVPGVPLVSARLECDASGARVHVEQRRSRVEAATRWQIPVCVRHGTGKDGARTCGVVGEPHGTVALGATCPTWWYANADGSGYYRVALGQDHLAALAAPGAYSDAEQLAQLRDVFAAVDRGELSPADVQALVAPLARDDSAYVATAGTELIDLLQPRWLDEARYGKHLAYIDRTLGARGRELGWVRAARDDDDAHELRRTIVLLVAEADPRLAAEGARHGRAWLDGHGTIEDDMVGNALWFLVHDGGADAFDLVLREARAATDHRKASRLLVALGSASDEALVQRALRLTLDDSLDPRDRLAPLYRLLYSRDGRDLAWAFVRDHLDELLATMRDDDAAGLLGFIATLPCEAERRAQTAALLAPRAEQVNGARNAVAQGLEQADRCIERRARDGAGIERFLSEQP